VSVVLFITSIPQEHIEQSRESQVHYPKKDTNNDSHRDHH